MSVDQASQNPNRLVEETSPYLLQHAYNPVDWRPWGAEALDAARGQDKPVFLSIGYSACHWCHVMEHESFENPDVAALMNDWFINIKVDREERPDLDQIYMNAVVALTGHGGWPMSVFLTPDMKPFYGGTYWPPEPQRGMPGFKTILEKVHEAWTERRDDVYRGADELTTHVVEHGLPDAEPASVDANLIRAATRNLLQVADRTHGGFGGAPKFPHPMDVRVLLRAWKRFGDEDALAIVRLTLDKMARGGIYDHLGGGFHRYSTDARWLVPHFEKMLYDNALLTSTYVEAFQATGEREYERVIRETLDYVLREMTQPEGGFYSTQDADSEGVEGKFFVWTEAEIIDELGENDARVFNYAYDVEPGGNWEGSSILNRPKPHTEAARALGTSEEELAERLARGREKLFEVRRRRVAPARDEKVLAGWNGLMISAMAQAGRVLREKRYIDAARSAADFVLGRMLDDGRLLHSFKDGRARFNAYLDDYACMIDGLVDLYQAAFDAKYLTAAVELAERMIDQFQDRDDGGSEQKAGFFYTSGDHEELIARQKDVHDQATPSGNATAAYALLRLSRLTGRTDLEDAGVGTLEFLAGRLQNSPSAGGQTLIAADFLIGPTWEVAVVDGSDASETNAVLSTLYDRFMPNKVVLRRTHGVDDADVPQVVRTVLEGKTSVDGEPTAYLCEHGACQAPVVGAEGLRTALVVRPD